jgi:tRNA nucleotidyltransferase (CCA-adding enzyme)
VLRHVSPAFSEDPVRILRVARFVARFAHWGFRVAHETNALMRRMVESGEVDHLVPERVWTELARALETNTPQRFFDALHGCGALARLFPELEPLYAGNPGRRHDGGSGAFSTLPAAVTLTGAAALRCAALVCDVSRAAGEAFDPPALAALCARLRAPADWRDLTMLVLRHRARVHAADTLSAEALLDLLGDLDALRRGERFEDILLVCRADARTPDDPLYPPAERLRAARRAAAAVAVDDLAGAQGTKIAHELRRRRIAAIRKIME